MPVPKRKRSRARNRKRFANKGLEFKAFTHCQNCKEAVMPHAACKACGYYKGIQVVASKLDRAEKRSAVRKVRESRRAVQELAGQESAGEDRESSSL